MTSSRSRTAFMLQCTMLVPALLLAVPAQPARAQQGVAQPAGPAAPAGQADFAEGEVRRLEKDAARVTLRHGEIRSIDMPPMTMTFGVRDRSLLNTVKVGDKVRFKAVNEAGKYLVTELEVLPR